MDEINIEVNGTKDFTTDTDSFGNIVINGSIIEAHNEFIVEIKGKVTTGLDILKRKTIILFQVIFLNTRPIIRVQEVLLLILIINLKFLKTLLITLHLK